LANLCKFTSMFCVKKIASIFFSTSQVLLLKFIRRNKNTNESIADIQYSKSINVKSSANLRAQFEMLLKSPKRNI